MGAFSNIEAGDKLVQLIEKTTRLRKIGAKEYAGPCSFCGGSDRMRINTEKGWFCRHCTGTPGSEGHWLDAVDFMMRYYHTDFKGALRTLGVDRRADPAEIERMENQRKAQQAEARRQEAEQQAKVHAQLTASPEWMTYHQHPQAAAEWGKRGLSPEWVNYYKLGYCPSRRYPNGDTWYESASLTIPYFRPTYTPNPEGGDDVTWTVTQLKHRLLADNTPGGKYRPHLSGAGNHLFYTDVFQRNVYGDLLIVEGEIKAMVTWAALWIGLDIIAPNLTVIGIPGQGWREEWLEQFDRADNVYICLDPGAEASAERLAKRITKPTKIILLPDKIDDLINLGVLDGLRLYGLLEG